MKKNSENKGFTLIELLVVIAIIGILSSVVLAALTKSKSSARDAQRLSDVRQIQNALEIYYQDFKSFPVPTGTNNTCNNLTLASKYISKVPTDPTNSATVCYKYATTTDPAVVVFYSVLENQTYTIGGSTYNKQVGISISKNDTTSLKAACVSTNGTGGTTFPQFYTSGATTDCVGPTLMGQVLGTK